MNGYKCDLLHLQYLSLKSGKAWLQGIALLITGCHLCLLVFEEVVIIQNVNIEHK